MNFTKVEGLSDYLNDLEMFYISFNSGGYILRNKELLNSIKLNDVSRFILKKSVFGTPIFKIGGSGTKVMILSGVHGNELSSQVASLSLIKELLNTKLKNAVYIIPFVAPKSTMNNLRMFNFRDLNRAAHIKNSLSNLILNTIKELKITAIGDFHTTAIKSNPGKEAIFCSKSPSKESFLIANYISSDIGSDVISYSYAGSSYKGAIEDECNLINIPAITGEVVSPFGHVEKGSVERSFLQMKSFLSYFGI